MSPIEAIMRTGPVIPVLVMNEVARQIMRAADLIIVPLSPSMSER